MAVPHWIAAIGDSPQSIEGTALNVSLLAGSLPISDTLIVGLIATVGSCLTCYVTIRVSMATVTEKLTNVVGDVVELKGSQSRQWEEINKQGKQIATIQGGIDAGLKVKAHHV